MRDIRILYSKYRNEFLLWAQVTHSVDYNQSIIVFRKALLAQKSNLSTADSEIKKKLFSLAESYLLDEDDDVLNEGDDPQLLSDEEAQMFDQLDAALNAELKEQLEDVDEGGTKPHLWKLLFIWCSLILLIVLLLHLLTD
ncbi:MAG: hypothetical protein NWQ53_10270 [Flavobacteriales bacterium]|nr:hypothetical protein [Flavobacteriales bacterium]